MQTEMKPWIILITHGKLGAEVKGSAEMIAGELKNVYSLSLMEYWKRNPITYRLSTGGRFFAV